MRRYDVKFISMEDFGALKRLVRKKRAAALLVVTSTEDWPSTTRMANGGKRRIRYDTIN